MHLTPGVSGSEVTAQFVVQHQPGGEGVGVAEGFCDFCSGDRCLHSPDESLDERSNAVSRSNARWSTYLSGGFQGTIYTVHLRDLEERTHYSYRCGVTSKDSVRHVLSEIFNFRTAPPSRPGTEDVVKAVTWGDMGAPGQGTKWMGMDSQKTIDALEADVLARGFELAINVGDSSYADDYPSHNSWVEDKWYNAMQGVMANAPTAVVVGNHEAQYEFAPHLHRTSMPVSGTGGALKRFYSSLDWGPLHIVGFSSEHPYDEGSEQHEFVVNDLRSVDRNKTPFVIVVAHRPMYCSSVIFSLPGPFFHRCITEAPRLRKPFEDVLKETGVDLFLSGHNHQFERSHPMYKGEAVTRGEKQGNKTVYRNPGAPIYIVNGAAGNREGNDPSWLPEWFVKWRAAHSTYFHMGYGRIQATRSQLDWEYVDATSGKVTDSFTLHRQGEH